MGEIIASHEHPEYVRRRGGLTGPGVWNGAFYYSQEIVRNIIPNVETWRPWVTINVQGRAADHAIVFVHNNKTPEAYAWLRKYRDLILICGVPSTCDKVSGLGRAVYLPLSIDVKEVRKHSAKKTRERAFAGRAVKRQGAFLGPNVDYIESMPRDRMLDEMARYKEIFAVGRCALEAKALGCKILPYDKRYPDPKFWKLYDNLEAAEMLQAELDRIDEKR